MNLTITADHEPDAAAKAWLPVYVKSEFDSLVDELNRFYVLLDPWSEFTGKLRVHLHPGDFDDGTGTMVSGLYRPLNERGFLNPNVNDRIEIAWSREFPNGEWKGPSVLRHELQHFISRQMGLDDGAFGHGHAEDPLIIEVKKFLNSIYHGDVRLRHVTNLSEDL